ncbi:3-deoxy-7-phosphoheptulonate synthase [Oscillospiraceae bacterium OttesenSCG-928-F05]|nr:3-deoxy-7-phosphoheptulonate synthase [Oscillospiraceae bacterium OttesenSCG-928-F05]
MVVIMRPTAPPSAVREMIGYMEKHAMQVQVNTGINCVVLGIIGDTHSLDRDKISLMPGVERVLPVQEPYKKAGRKFHPEDSVFTVGGRKIGGEKLAVMAGPCSVETAEQIAGVARSVAASGAAFLRGGAYKPRTSPYAFQGLEDSGLDMLVAAREATGLPIVSEIVSARHLERFVESVDILQIGARNMQNYALLKEVGAVKKPVLLKRGFSATVEEWLMSAEYIMSGGNREVILCERGIRTFETATRNTLDLSAVIAVKTQSHLPVIVDPSHASGLSHMVEPLAMAAVAAGADGVMVEVHNNPPAALCDGPQSITPEAFDGLMKKLSNIAGIVGREV